MNKILRAIGFLIFGVLGVAALIGVTGGLYAALSTVFTVVLYAVIAIAINFLTLWIFDVQSTDAVRHIIVLILSLAIAYGLIKYIFLVWPGVFYWLFKY
jgi:hypothetical protein